MQGKPFLANAKVRVVPLAYQLMFQTDGATGNWVYLDLNLPDITGWGPSTEQIIIHADTLNRTTNFVWKMVLYWSFDGVKWSSPIDVSAEMGAALGNMPLIHNPFTSATSLGLRIRLGLACKPSTGTAQERAQVGATAVFVFRS